MTRPLQPPWLLPLHHLLILLSFLAPPSPTRRRLSLLLIPLTFIPVLLRPISTDPAASYGAATTWVITLRAITVHLFSTPYPELVHRRETDPVDIASLSLLRKLEWTVSLLFSPRLIGFSQRPQPSRPNDAPSESTPTPSRITFILRALLHSALLYLAIDLGRCYTLTQAYTLPLGDPLFQLPSETSALHLRLLNLAAQGTSAWCFISLQYHLLSLLFVLFGSSPASWPPLFGSLSDASSLTKLWGGVWHQLLRTTIAPWGRAVGQVAGWAMGDYGQRGTIGYRIVIVMTGFALSGLGHAAAVWGVNKSLGGGAWGFFLWQGIGVGLEGLVGWGEEVNGWKRWAGMAWVLGWLLWTAGAMADELVLIGLYTGEPLPWSPVRAALGAVGMGIERGFWVLS
ncbi:hypothetical protein FPQ18DRAFT_412621 [Pyronema domesticum]|nr:hypothetical protein FPQ18DRAFT_412621 [Pyronema domesticum]